MTYKKNYVLDGCIRPIGFTTNYKNLMGYSNLIKWLHFIKEGKFITYHLGGNVFNKLIFQLNLLRYQFNSFSLRQPPINISTRSIYLNYITKGRNNAIFWQKDEDFLNVFFSEELKSFLEKTLIVVSFGAVFINPSKLINKQLVLEYYSNYTRIIITTILKYIFTIVFLILPYFFVLLNKLVIILNYIINTSGLALTRKSN